MNLVNCHSTTGLYCLPGRIFALAFILGKGNIILHDLSLVLMCSHLAGALHSHLPVLLSSVHPSVGLAAHPNLTAAKPSQPYNCVGLGLCSMLLNQLNKSAVSGLRAVVAGAVRVNATHI